MPSLPPLQQGEGKSELAVRRVVAVGTWVAAVSFGLTLVTGIIEGTVLPYDRLNPLEEESFVDWASAGATLIAAFVCATHAVVSPRQRRVFAVLAGFVLYISLDDSFVIHETVGSQLSEHSSLLGKFGLQIWTMAYAPLLLATAILLWRVVTPGRADTKRLLLVAFACFAGAIAIEVISELGNPWPMLVTEEALELSGWELVATALTATLVGTLFWFDRPPSAGGERTQAL